MNFKKTTNNFIFRHSYHGVDECDLRFLFVIIDDSSLILFFSLKMQVLFGVIADTTNSTVLLWTMMYYNQVIKKLHTLTQFLFHILHSVFIHFYI